MLQTSKHCEEIMIFLIFAYIISYCIYFNELFTLDIGCSLNQLFTFKFVTICVAQCTLARSESFVPHCLYLEQHPSPMAGRETAVDSSIE